jgi:hypothetical protein
MGIKPPLDIEVLRRQLEKRRGKRIVIRPAYLPPRTYGLCKPYASIDVILYQSETTRAHQTQIILHEFGHLVLGHPGDEIGPVENFAAFEERKQAAPHLPVEFLSGTMYNACDKLVYEQEVELWATIVRDWDQALAQLMPLPSGGAARRLDTALSDHVGWE